MRYVAHRAFSGKTMNGLIISIPIGAELERMDSILYYDGVAVCVYRSLVGKQHFAIDADGCGMERGALTYALAYAPRYRQGGVLGGQQRFTDEELEILSSKWEKYIKPNLDMLLFNDIFFEASPDELKRIAASVHVVV